MLTRRASIRLANLPLVKRISIWRADRAYRRWARRNPGKSFADFYVERVEGRARSGRPHPTLGTHGFAKGQGESIHWDQASFAERGLENWQQFLDFGLQPHMRCVDYGCGSLRLGQHAIRYLDRGNYWGVDVSQGFMEAGLELIGDELVAEKRPRLSLIDRRSIEDIGRWAPDFIMCNAVLQHVPEDELPTFFERLAAMMAGGAFAYVIFVEAEEVARFKAASWAYPPAFLERIAQAACPQFSVRFFPAGRDYQSVAGGHRALMVLGRPAAAQAQGMETLAG
jgi:SAM-dependent methyltransferase